MLDKIKVMNFLQDFGCAKLEHLQILFNDEKNNFKSVLDSNMVSRKNNIYVHNTRTINERMLVALDILCKFKNRIKEYHIGYDPVLITFLSKDELKYHIIVADEDNTRGIVKKVNDYLMIPEADRLILVFPNTNEFENIECKIPFIYVTYPNLDIINSKKKETPQQCELNPKS